MGSPQLPSSFDGNTEFYEESRFQKFTRRLKEEPLVPLGCALTCYALYRASRSIRAGDHHTTNRMFRARIYGQAFTLLCIVAGSIYYKEERAKRKEFEGALGERKVLEKKEAWIRELEARDREDKEYQAKRDALRKSKMGEVAETIKSQDDKASQAKKDILSKVQAEEGVAKAILEQLEQGKSIGVLAAVKDLYRR